MITFYELMDRQRRRQGGILDMMALGPVETPSRTVLADPAFTLKAYGDERGRGPVVLIVPAPIKRAYIWDLVPHSSVVRRCLDGGIRVYLIQWETPGVQEQGLGLEDYAERFIRSCTDAVSADAGRTGPFLAGHSLGGTFASVFAALHPGAVLGLVLLGAPIRFGADVGDLDAFIARTPNARLFIPKAGSVPGSFLSAVSTLASPWSFQTERWADWLASLSDLRLLETHLRVVRWTLDELPMPGLLFCEIVEELYRRNRFMKGTLVIRGRPALPEKVMAPVLTVADRLSTVVPPEASLSFHHAAGSPDTRVLWYEQEVGVALQHIGMLVGKRAHRFLWPQIIRWIHAHS